MAAAEPVRPRALTGADADEAYAVPLRRGRTLTLAPAGDDDLVEIRSSSGTLELRIRITEQGPVLEVETVRLSLRASESIDVDTKDFTVRAAGEIALTGKADVRVGADGDVHVTGETIYLN